VKMHRIRDELFKTLERQFPAACFLVMPIDDCSIHLEWDSGPQVSKIRALAAPLLEGVKLYTCRSEPCFICRTFDGVRGDEDILLCPNCWRVL